MMKKLLLIAGLLFGLTGQVEAQTLGPANLRVPTSGWIEFDGGTLNTFTCTGGHCSIEGATLWDSGNDGAGSTLDADLLDGITSADFLTELEAVALYQPLDADLTSWASVTRASGFDTWATTPTSANLRTYMTDEIGSSVLVFLGTPADDQVPVGDSASATTWRTIPDSDGATQKLQYDQTTNSFSAGTDDDVPESGDFTNLTGGTGITNSAGTLSVDGTELGTVTWGSGSTVTWTFDAGATDPVLTFTSNQLAITSAAAVTLSGTLDLSGITTSTLSSPGAGRLAVEGTDVVLTSRTLTGGTGIAAIGDLSSDRTISLDLTELSTATFGAGSFTTLTFDAGATDPVFTFGSNSLAMTNMATWTSTGSLVIGYSDSAADTGGLAIDDSGTFRMYETEANGDNYFELIAPDALAGNVTCTIDSNGRIPDSCVGNGVDDGGGAGGDNVRVEDGDNAGTFTDVDTTADFEDSGDINFTITDGGAGGPDAISATVRADSVALTTDTTGNYVKDVADGTGIDGTASGEGTTYTPTLDLTEINSATWGSGTFTTFTFDAGAVDPLLTFGSGTLLIEAVTSLRQADASNAGGQLKLLEDPGTGSNFISFLAPASITADVTCTLEDDSSPIPDSCVGDGTDGGGIGGSTGATDNSILRADGVGGATVQNSVLIIADTSGAISGAGSGFSIEFFGASGTDTTLTAPSAGDLNIEGNRIYRAGGTDVAVADGGTGASTLNDLITLSTMTTGSYVQQVADGTGIDGTANAEGATYTPTLDLTEISSTTWGAGAFTTMTFDAGATDPTWTYASNKVSLTNAAELTLGSTTTVAQDDYASAALTPAFQVSGTSAALGAVGIITFANSATTPASLNLGHAAGASVGTFTAVTSGDDLAVINFTGADGTNNEPAASILVEADAATGANDMPGRMTFATTADGAATPTGRLTLDSSGNLWPVTNDGVALGKSGNAFADLWLASGGTIEWDGGTTNTMTCTAGDCTIEGNRLFRVGGTDVPVADGGTGASSLTDLITLGTHTTGSYVQQVADGTGIDGTANAESATYTPTLDLTEINSATWGSGTFTTFTFDAGATDPLLTFGSGTLLIEAVTSFRQADAANAGGQIKWLEDPGTGSNFISILAPASITSDVTCTLENDSNPIPDSCVGDGTDAGGVGGSTGATDNAILRADGTGGATAQNSVLVIADTSGAISGAGSGFSIEFFGASGTDTTLTAPSAGDLNIEGNRIYRAGGTDVAVADGGTGASSLNDLITLTTMTTGSYVQQVADGTGIDGTANAEGATYTPTLDLTEISSTTWGAGSFTTMTFDAGATDPVFTFASNKVSITSAAELTLGSTTTVAQDDYASTALTPAFQISGTSAATGAEGIITFAASATTPASLNLGHAAGASVGTFTAVSSGDDLAVINVTGADGTNNEPAASILFEVDAATGANDMPGRITFNTTADGAATPTARLTLDSAGVLFPATNDGVPLGKSGNAFADLWLASGGLIEFDGGTTNSFTCTGGNCTIEGNGVYRAGGTDVALADGGTGASLSDPNIDELVGWDDSAGAVKFMALADINTEVAPASGDFLLMYDAAGNLLKTDWSNLPGGGGLPADPGANSVLGWDDTANQAEWWNPGTGLTASTSTIDCDTPTETAVGCIELATTAEADTGTDTARAVTPAGVLAAVAGKQTLWVPAASMIPNVTSGAATGAYDSGSNDLTIPTLDFDTGATEERADFQVALPKEWDEGTLTFIPISVCTACSAAQTIQFELACVAVSHDDTLNATMGTAQSSSVTVTATNDSQVGAESSAITCGGTPAESDLVAFRISRDTSVDDAAGDARLIGVKVFWTSNNENSD